jgi:hypothetical protein
MLKEQVFKIYDDNLSKLKTEGESVSYKQLLDSDIHPALKNYVSAELKLLFYKDKSIISKKSVFNYSSPKVEFYFNQIFDELVRFTLLSKEELNNLLLQSISFNLSHLIKPNWSLKKLIFNEKKSINSSDFFYLLDYAFFYPHQKQIISKYFKKRNSISINLDEFEHTLDKIDQQIFDNYKKDIVKYFFNTAIDFLDLATSNSLPIDIILNFLSDKSLEDVLHKTKEYASAVKQNSFSYDEFEKIIFKNSENSVSENVDEVIQDSEKSDYQKTLDSNSSSDDFINKVDLSSTTEADSKLEKSKSENLSLFDDESLIPIDEVDELDYHSQDEIIFQEPVEKPIERGVTSFDKTKFINLLSSKEIRRIQENLFNSDSEDFINFIEIITSASDFQESLSILDQFISDYKLEDTSKEVEIIKIALKKFYEVS